MKRIILSWSLVTLVVLAGCQPIVAPTSQDEIVSPATTQSDTYTDPQERFTVPIPTNWSATTRDGYAWLTSPEEAIEVAIVVVPGSDLEEDVAQAWTMVDPAFDTPISEVTELPAAGGVERALSVDYDTGESPVVVAAIALLVKGNAYLLLVRGELVAISQRSSQLAIIQSGLEIADIDEVDLAGLQPLPFSDEIRIELESYIQRKLTEFSIPGASVSVVQDGEIVFAQGFGVRELGNDAPVTPETLMMIGSSGKTMTTMMMATVVDDGLMTWDTRVQEVLPQFSVADPQLSQEITMRNLVCACTGVPRRDLEWLFNANELSAEDVVESLQNFQFFTEFGEAFQYSNQLVATGGYAAAVAAGGEWGNLYDAYLAEMNSRIFDPIGMNSTTFSFEEVMASENYALPHSVGVEVPFILEPLESEQLLRPLAPAGAHWSNALDMGRYLITELNQGIAPDGERVVSAENLAVTWEPQVPVSANASYGLGWFVDTYKGQPMIHHGGNTLGFTSDLAFLPEGGIGISVVTNGRITNAFNEAVRFRLLELLFEQPMEYDVQADFTNQAIRQATEDSVEGAVPVDEERVEPFVGNYQNPELGELEMRWEDDALFFDSGELNMEIWAMPAEAESGEETTDSDDAVEYIIYDAPLTGQPLRLEMNDEGQPQIVLDAVTEEYIFTRLE